MSNYIKVRNYIKAKSAKRLRLLMYEKQVKSGFESLPFDIVFDGKFFYAWFYEELKQIEQLEEVLSDNKTD